jgi:hypothetical protein
MNTMYATSATRLHLLIAGSLCLLSPAAADELDLSWYTVDGGGDMWTTGGSLELSGTIGQPDTDGNVTMTGSTLSLTGGFWALPTTPQYQVGDVNCDGTVNAFDIDPFVLALTDPENYTAAYPGCDIDNADCNGDGVVNAFDIDPFVLCLTGGGCPPSP